MWVIGTVLTQEIATHTFSDICDICLEGIQGVGGVTGMRQPNLANYCSTDQYRTNRSSC